MEFGWGTDLDQFRQTVRDWINSHKPEDIEFNMGEGENWRANPKMIALKKEMDDRGWLKQAWPAEYGGSGKSPFYQFILVEELSYRGIPMTDLSTGSIAPAIMNFGTEEQKSKWLPDVWEGKMTFAIGYSEPNAGTDLASLETRAARDGDDWVINGQKLWTSEAHTCTHVWLAARTDPNAPKHRGISMFIVPLASQGVTVRPIRIMSGGRTNETFYEDVRVGADALVGEEGRGWYTVANALDHERVTISPLGGAVRAYDELMEYLKEHRADLIEDRAVRARLAQIFLDHHVLRALKLVTAAIISNRQTPNAEASMVKVWASELRQRLDGVAMDLLGRYGALSRESGDIAPVGGAFDAGYRGSPVGRFGGGTNEVQRNIIAQRGMHLPR